MTVRSTSYDQPDGVLTLAQDTVAVATATDVAIPWDSAGAESLATIWAIGAPTVLNVPAKGILTASIRGDWDDDAVSGGTGYRALGYKLGSDAIVWVTCEKGISGGGPSGLTPQSFTIPVNCDTVGEDFVFYARTTAGESVNLVNITASLVRDSGTVVTL